MKLDKKFRDRVERIQDGSQSTKDLTPLDPFTGMRDTDRGRASAEPRWGNDEFGGAAAGGSIRTGVGFEAADGTTPIKPKLEVGILEA